MKGRLIAGLNIGSSAIRIAVGQLAAGQDRSPNIALIGAAETTSSGITKAAISSFEDAVSSISACLEQAERTTGLPIQDAYVSVGGAHIQVQEAKGIIGVNRPDQTIRKEDVIRALEAARTFANQPNFDTIHVPPRRFSVDNQKDIRDPAGMQGIRLEAEVKVIQGLSNHLRNMTKAVFRTNVDIDELVYAPLASTEAVTTKRERELGVCVVTIGAATTGIAVYEDNELRHATTLLMGSDHITSDIVYMARTSFDVAERIKRMRGTASPEAMEGDVQADVREFGAETSETIDLRFVAEVIEARVEEIFQRVEAELQRMECSGLLPAGIVLTGGGAKLPGLTDVARRTFHLPAVIGSSQLESSIPELIQDPAFSTAVGLVQWGFEAERTAGPNLATPLVSAGNVFTKVSEPLKRIFRSFMP